MCIYGNQIYYQNHCMVYHLKVLALRIRLQCIGTIIYGYAITYYAIILELWYLYLVSACHYLFYCPFLIYSSKEGRYLLCDIFR